MKELAKIGWKSPSNIAFIKYWGKHGNQLPQNSSLSMTLSKCTTETYVSIYKKENKSPVDFKFFFHGKENQAFSGKIHKYLNKLVGHLSFLKGYSLKIESTNNFPHSAGIASSASAMSALALCLLSAEQRLGTNLNGEMYQEASSLARIGSGSASRSLFKEYAVWGETPAIYGSSNEYARELPFPIHKTFLCLRDTILIIDKEEKKVSSSAGHSLMEKHPYATTRFKNANENLQSLIRVMRTGDFEEFAFILEHEALSLHAMMMTARPWYSLLSPNTIAAIQRVKEFREQTGANICFTLDAGPNIHLIYPATEDKQVQPFIETELLQYCEGKKYLADNIGLGPELLVDQFQ